MEKCVAQLQRHAEVQEKYQRRLLSRINGVEIDNDCSNKCKKILKI